MANNFVTVTPSGSGVKMQTFENTVGGNTVDAEAVALVDTTGASILLTNDNAAPAANNIGVLPAIANASAPTYTEGDQVLHSTDLSGNTRVVISGTSPVSGTVTANQGTAAANTAGWPTTNGGVAESTAAWTSATTLNTTLRVNTAGYSTVMVTFSAGTISSGAVTFEVSDTTAFTNAYGVVGLQSNQLNNNNVDPRTIEGPVGLTTNGNVSYIFSVAAMAAFQVRLSTVIGGAGTVNVGITLIATPATSTSIIAPVGGAAFPSRSVLTGQSTSFDNQLLASVYAGNGNQTYPVGAAENMFGGAFSGTANTALQGWSRARTSTVFKTVQATASGNTAVWTPGSGNKFRLLGYQIEGDNLALTAAGTLTVSFQDASTGMPIAHDIYIPATVVAGSYYNSGFRILGQFGILSAAANNALNVNLSFALTGTGGSGNIRVNVQGTEE